MVTPLQEFATPRVARPVIPTTKMASSGNYQSHGSPEGVVPAHVGAECIDLDTGDIYKKLSGVGTKTGWNLSAVGGSIGGGAVSGLTTKNTIADAQAMTTAQMFVAGVVVVKGGAAAYDGGGGVYVYEAALSDPDDGITHLRPVDFSSAGLLKKML